MYIVGFLNEDYLLTCMWDARKKKTKKQRLHFILHAKILLKWILQKRNKKKITEVEKKKKTTKNQNPNSKSPPPPSLRRGCYRGWKGWEVGEQHRAFRWPYSL